MAIKDIPAGYWQDANGNLIPESKVKDIDKLRHQVVTDLCKAAEQHRDGLREYKLHAMQEVGALVATSLEQYGVKSGGEKGNVTLTSFDGEYKVVRSMQDKIVFGEQLMAAKALIDECVVTWSKNSDDNIKVLVNHAFQTDREGKINTGRVLGLRPSVARTIEAARPFFRFYPGRKGLAPRFFNPDDAQR